MVCKAANVDKGVSLLTGGVAAGAGTAGWQGAVGAADACVILCAVIGTLLCVAVVDFIVAVLAKRVSLLTDNLKVGWIQ